MSEIVAEDKPCALCGLPVKVAGFELNIAEDRKIFCCLGCQAIYTLYRSADDEPSTSFDSGNDLNQSS